ncbi:hypothetical protein P4O66_014050, partial [Electrophorus voltai]
SGTLDRHFITKASDVTVPVLSSHSSEMSLFKARDWWSAVLAEGEEFDQGCLCVGDVDNTGSGYDKVVVGSYMGMLRVFAPHASHPGEGPAAGAQLLEVQIQDPIIQVEVGKFVSCSELLHLAVLHPRKLSVYAMSGVAGNVEHGDQYQLRLVYEHNLQRTACNMTFGPFGGVTGHHFICVQSMDGVLTFFEQDSYAFGRFLPAFLLPGPLCYCARTDAFITVSSTRQVECYRYETLAVAMDADTRQDLEQRGKSSGKRLTADWTLVLGEQALDICVPSTSPSATSSIFVLGERNLFCLLDNGQIRFMKKLEYSPSCFLPYASVAEGVTNLLLGNHNNMLLVYQDTTLKWAAQLNSTPVAVRVANFPAGPSRSAFRSWLVGSDLCRGPVQGVAPKRPVLERGENGCRTAGAAVAEVAVEGWRGSSREGARVRRELKGLVVTLSAKGHLLCSYMGTDPSFFTAPKVDAREVNYEEVDAEMKALQKVIRRATKNQDIIPRPETEADLTVIATVSPTLDDVSIRVSSRSAVQSPRMSVCVQPPLMATQDQFVLESLGMGTARAGHALTVNMTDLPLMDEPRISLPAAESGIKAGVFIVQFSPWRAKSNVASGQMTQKQPVIKKEAGGACIAELVSGSVSQLTVAFSVFLNGHYTPADLTGHIAVTYSSPTGCESGLEKDKRRDLAPPCRASLNDTSVLEQPGAGSKPADHKTPHLLKDLYRKSRSPESGSTQMLNWRRALQSRRHGRIPECRGEMEDVLCPQLLGKEASGRIGTDSQPCSLHKAGLCLIDDVAVGVPRVIQCKFALPLLLVCCPSQASKNAKYKITVDTNQPPVSLSEVFPERHSPNYHTPPLSVLFIPTLPLLSLPGCLEEFARMPEDKEGSALGFQLVAGARLTALASRSSQRYRIQSETFEDIWLVAKELVQRLNQHFTKLGVKDFHSSFSGPIPLPEYFDIMDHHFELRLTAGHYEDLLSERAVQFRAVQRRLLTRFKDKTPAPLHNLDTLMEGTYRQVMALADTAEANRAALVEAFSRLRSSTHLLILLLSLWQGLGAEQTAILDATLLPVLQDTPQLGWEESVDVAVSHLLRTCLSRSPKDQAIALSTTQLSMPKDTSRLKKHIALLCDRIGKGGRLSLSSEANTPTPVMMQAASEGIPEPIAEEEEEPTLHQEATARLLKKNPPSKKVRRKTVCGGGWFQGLVSASLLHADGSAQLAQYAKRGHGPKKFDGSSAGGGGGGGGVCRICSGAVRGPSEASRPPPDFGYHLCQKTHRLPLPLPHLIKDAGDPGHLKELRAGSAHGWAVEEKQPWK